MRFPRPRSLNGLILVGFGLVALPLLVAVIWALVNLDRLAEQSEQLVITGVRPSCGCATAGPYNNKIPPKERGKIPISMNTRLAGSTWRQVGSSARAGAGPSANNRYRIAAAGPPWGARLLPSGPMPVVNLQGR